MLLGIIDEIRDRTGRSSHLIVILFAFDAFIDLFAVDRDILGGIDANTHLVAFHAQYRDRNLVADHHGFANTSRQYQHIPAPIFFGNCSGALQARIALNTRSLRMLAIGCNEKWLSGTQEYKSTRIPIAIVTSSYQNK
jgi:hypothetical protein